MTSLAGGSQAGPTAARVPLGRLWPPVAGLVFVVVLIAVFLTPVGDDVGDTPAEVVAYADANEGWMVAAALFALVSIVLLASFVAGLYARLRPVLGEAESVAVVLGGGIFAVMTTIAWLIWTGPLIDMASDEALALSQAEAYLAIDDIGWLALGAGGVGAAVMAVVASRAAMRVGIPVWLGWVGIVLGVLAAATVGFFGIFAWMAWIAGASIVMLLRRVEP